MEYIMGADPVREIAGDIIGAYYPDILEANLSIAYMWRSEAMSLGEGRVAAGQCAHVGDREHTIHGYDFLIIMARDVWEDASDEFRRAVVDHELSHIGIRPSDDGDGKFAHDEDTGRIKTYVRRHEVEEFSPVLERHGAYHSSLVRFLNSYGRRDGGA